MKILSLSHIFPPAIDGGSRVIFKLSQKLADYSNQTLYLSSNCRSTDDFVNSDSPPISTNNPQILRLPVHRRLRRLLKALTYIFPPQSFISQLLHVLQKGPIFKLVPFIIACCQVKKFKPDLIIAGPLPTTIILYAHFFKIITGAKLLINASFHPTDPDFTQSPLLSVLSQADYLWTLNSQETNYFISQLKIDPQKIILCGNGIDNNYLTQDKVCFPQTPHLIYIGSFAVHKNIELLLEAFSLTHSLFPNIKLTLAGQKTLYFPQLEKAFKHLSPNLQSKITILLDPTDEQIRHLIDSSTLLIQPSSQESFGLVLIESLARGKPVIVSNIPPLEELINNTRGGLSFTLPSAQALSQKIIDLIKNRQYCRLLGSAGREYVKKHYTWDKIGESIWQKVRF